MKIFKNIKLFFGLILIIALIPVIYFASATSVQIIQREDQLLASGFKVIHTHCCIDFQGCSYNRVYEIGNYEFKCLTHELGFYRDNYLVRILGKEEGGNRFYYLCLQDHELCYQGLFEQTDNY